MPRALITLVVVLFVATLAPLALANGGFNPPPDGTKIVGPAVGATFVMDSHATAAAYSDPLPPGVFITTKSGQASVQLRKGALTSGAVFNMPDGTRNLLFPNFGCDASLTEARFTNAPLSQLMPGAIVTQLFADLGLTVEPSLVVITDVDNAVCTEDPDNPALPGPGTLSFDAVIQFVVPRN